jgi:hypothetical protein
MEHIDWARFKNMPSKDKAEINTESTFSEQRNDKEQERKEKEGDFGLGKMQEEINIDWSGNDNKAKR